MIKTAKILFYCISGMLILTGLVYVFNPHLMRYHYHFLGVSPDRIDPRVFILMQSAKQITGGLMLGVGASVIMMTMNIQKAPGLILPAMTILLYISLMVSLYAVVRVGEIFPITLVLSCLALLTASLAIIWMDRGKIFA